MGHWSAPTPLLDKQIYITYTYSSISAAWKFKISWNFNNRTTIKFLITAEGLIEDQQEQVKLK